MKILVACEESQAVCIEFRKLGHDAYSCDTLPCSGGYPEYHLQQDVTELLLQRWDMIVAFPPCTFLCAAGACRMYPQKGVLDKQRYDKGLLAKNLFMNLKNANCTRIAIENPTPLKVFELPQPSQVIQPFQYGHPYSKRTCLWLKGLPQLIPTEIISEGVTSWIGAGSKDQYGKRRANVGKIRNTKTRSKTFSGIASAMAEQWGG